MADRLRLGPASCDAQVMKKHGLVIYLGAWLVLFLFSVDWSAVYQLCTGTWELTVLASLAREAVGALDIGSAVALAGFAAFAYHQARKDEDSITLILTYPNGQREEISDAFEREHFNRGELQGLLRANNSGATYQISHLNTDVFRKDLRRVQRGETAEIVIPLNPGDTYAKINKAWDATGTPVFLNWSNQPLASWSETQKNAAQDLVPEGALTDVAFPRVDPAAPESEIQKQAAQEFEALSDQLHSLKQNPVGALVAGEPAMSVHLVRHLQAHQVPCYVATTTKSSNETADEFTFVQFRPWPKL